MSESGKSTGDSGNLNIKGSNKNHKSDIAEVGDITKSFETVMDAVGDRQYKDSSKFFERMSSDANNLIKSIDKMVYNDTSNFRISEKTNKSIDKRLANIALTLKRYSDKSISYQSSGSGFNNINATDQLKNINLSVIRLGDTISKSISDALKGLNDNIIVSKDTKPEEKQVKELADTVKNQNKAKSSINGVSEERQHKNIAENIGETNLYNKLKILLYKRTDNEHNEDEKARENADKLTRRKSSRFEDKYKNAASTTNDIIKQVSKAYTAAQSISDIQSAGLVEFSNIATDLGILSGRDSYTSTNELIKTSINEGLVNPVGVMGKDLAEIGKTIRNTRIDLVGDVKTGTYGKSEALARITDVKSQSEMIARAFSNIRINDATANLKDSSIKNQIHKRFEMLQLIAENTGQSAKSLQILSFNNETKLRGLVSGGVLTDKQHTRISGAETIFGIRGAKSTVKMIDNFASSGANFDMMLTMNPGMGDSMANYGGVDAYRKAFKILMDQNLSPEDAFDKFSMQMVRIKSRSERQSALRGSAANAFTAKHYGGMLNVINDAGKLGRTVGRDDKTTGAIAASLITANDLVNNTLIKRVVPVIEGILNILHHSNTAAVVDVIGGAGIGVGSFVGINKFKDLRNIRKNKKQIRKALLNGKDVSMLKPVDSVGSSGMNNVAKSTKTVDSVGSSGMNNVAKSTKYLKFASGATEALGDIMLPIGIASTLYDGLSGAGDAVLNKGKDATSADRVGGFFGGIGGGLVSIADGVTGLLGYDTHMGDSVKSGIQYGFRGASDITGIGTGDALVNGVLERHAMLIAAKGNYSNKSISSAKEYLKKTGKFKDDDPVFTDNYWKKTENAAISLSNQNQDTIKIMNNIGMHKVGAGFSAFPSLDDNGDILNGNGFNTNNPTIPKVAADKTNKIEVLTEQTNVILERLTEVIIDNNKELARKNDASIPVLNTPLSPN